MEIASSGMATYGNEFSEIIGLVTAGTEIMSGRSTERFHEQGLLKAA